MGKEFSIFIRRGWMFWSFLVACTTVLNLGLAQDKTVAKSRFKEGIRYIEEENYSDALTVFEESYRLYPNHNLLFNIGMCQKALYRYVDSIETLERFLGAEEKIPPEIRRDAEAALREMQTLVGQLRLEGAPDGAVVQVDSEKVATTPTAEPLNLMPGKHTLTVTKEGYDPLETQITIAADAEVTVNVLLTLSAQEEPAARPEEAPAEVEARQANEPAQRPVVVDKKEKLSPILISGIVIGAVGLAGVGVGTYFAIQYDKDFDELERAAAEGNETRYNDFKDKWIPLDEAGIIGSFVAGGALLATGIVLVVIDVTKKEQKRPQGARLAPIPGGISVTF